MRHATSMHAIVATLLLAMATTGHYVVRSVRTPPPPDGLLDGIPAQMGGYAQAGPDVEIPQRWKEVLQTNNILMRNYQAQSGRFVQLTVVMAGASRRSLHFPEVCLRGQGFEILNQDTAPVGVSFLTKRLVLGKGDVKEAVMYWFKVGDRFTDNFFVNSMHWAWGQVTFRPAQSSMIKVSTFIGPGGEEAAFAELENFSELLGPELLDRI